MRKMFPQIKFEVPLISKCVRLEKFAISWTNDFLVNIFLFASVFGTIFLIFRSFIILKRLASS